MPEPPAVSSDKTPAEPAPPGGDGADGHQGLLKSAGVVAIMTIISRVLGLWRFNIMARMFGAGYQADAFNFAFVAPNLTRRLFGEGALTSAFVPVFSGQLAKGDKEAANRTGSILITKVTTWLSIGCLVMIAIAAAVRWILLHRAPGLASPGNLLLLELFQWMLPYLIFINVACVLMAILNSLDHFWMPNFAPVILNVCIIAACYFIAPQFGANDDERIWAVAYAVLIGGVLQLLVQIPPALKLGFRFHPTVDASDPGYREVIDNFKPVILLVAVFQANVLMDNIIAKEFIAGDGPVTYLNMGTSIYQMVWSIVALALATVSLPALARFWSVGKKEEFNHTLLWGLRMAIFWTLPCTIGLMLMSDDIVRLMYGYGRFLENDAEPVRRTAGVAMYSSLGLVFFSVNALLARALYAMKDMRTPTITSAQSVAINLALNLVFVIGGNFLALGVKDMITNPVTHEPVNHHWVVTLLLNAAYSLGTIREGGIALASTISNGWQTWMLARAVRKRLYEQPETHESGTSRFIWEMAAWGVISMVFGIGVYQYCIHQKEWESFYGFFAAIFVGLGSFWFMCRQHFDKELKRFKDKQPAATTPPPAHHIYNVPDEHWSEQLKLQYAIYSSVASAAIMGFVVWAMRDSLPPEGRTFGLVLQRALIPVVVGAMVYFMASSGFLSREWSECKQMLSKRLRKTSS